MSSTYAKAINDCAARQLFDWGDVQQGTDIQDRVAEALQVTFLEILDEHAIKGVYCSRDLAPDDDQGEAEMNIDDQLTCDLATMPRSIKKRPPLCQRKPRHYGWVHSHETSRGRKYQDHQEGGRWYYRHRAPQWTGKHHQAMHSAHNVTGENDQVA